MKSTSNLMKVRYCPYCVELVHFEADQPVQRCWNCHEVSNFDLVKTSEQLWGLRLLRGISGAIQWLLSPIAIAAQWGVERLCLRPTAAARFVLVVAVPAVVTMLLVCNSVEVRIVRDLTASFTLP